MFIEPTEKEYYCKKCLNFYNSNELEESNCPICETDEFLFINELLNDNELLENEF